MSARVPDPSTAAPLREALARGNYHEGGVRVALGGPSNSSPGDAPVHALRLADDDQAQLVRLFMLGLDVETERAERALAPVGVSSLADAGFLEVQDGGVRSPIRISPLEEILLVHDPETIDAPDADVVTGLNSAARTLLALTPRPQVARALDLGCGSGIQALLLAGHADHVVATDVNTRALAYTALGAALSGLDNVEVREGSFFDPVEGDEFDLIASNPPYVISPDTQFVYRDGGLVGDEVSRLALQGTAAHLADGGLAMVLCNWLHDPMLPWDGPLREWLDGSGCDALLLHHVTEEALEYAEKWNTHLRRDPQAHAAALDRWLAAYAEGGYRAFGTGGVALRRRAGARDEPRITTAEMATGPSGRGGEQVLRLLAAGDLLAERSADELLAMPLAVAPAHRIMRERRHRDGGYGPETVRMVLDHSAGLHAEFGPAVAALLVGLDGTRTAADLLPVLARALPGPDDEVRVAVLGAVKTLLSLGLVEEAQPAAASAG